MNFDQSTLPTRLVKAQKKNYKGKRKTTDESTSLKVVYISSPVKVKTSASRFRSLVQELTGKHSDISQYMDDNNYARGDFHHEIDCGEEEDIVDRESSAKEEQASDDHRKLVLSSSISLDDTPTSSEYSLGGPVDDSMFISQMNEQYFEGIFSSDSSFYDDPSRMDVLGSFDELLYG